jgi:hypothetical protein
MDALPLCNNEIDDSMKLAESPPLFERCARRENSRADHPIGRNQRREVARGTIFKFRTECAAYMRNIERDIG